MGPSTTATGSASGGRLRNASPRIPASRIGNTNTQNTASGSRNSSRSPGQRQLDEGRANPGLARLRHRAACGRSGPRTRPPGSRGGWSSWETDAPCAASAASSAGTVRWTSRTVSRQRPSSWATPSTLGRPRSASAESAGAASSTRELDHVLRAQRRDQLPGRAEGDRLAVVHDRHAVAQPRGFFHVVGRQQHGAPARLERLDDAPGREARLRVESGGGLVEEQQLRDPPRARTPATAAASGRPTAPFTYASSFSWSCTRASVVVDAPAARVEAAEERDHLPHLQLVRELRLLELDAQAGAQRQAVAVPALAQDLDLAVVRLVEALADLDGGGLAGAVRAEQAEAFADDATSRSRPSTATTEP